MRVLRGAYEGWVPPEGGAAVAIGVYDGVHRGHQAVLAALRARASELGELPVTVLTFDRHPLEIIDLGRAPRLLTSEERKLELLAAHGADVVAVLTFDEETRALTPDDFAADILAGGLGASVVAVGADFRFGKGRAGDVEELRTLGLGLGFYVEVLELVGDGRPVSSTAIRAAVTAGDVAAAAHGLGRPFELGGIVVAGEGRGRQIGFPTANVEVDPRLLVPGRGVYAVWAVVAGSRRPGVVNIGVRPTFGEEREVVEVHLLDYDGDLYGAEVTLEFAARLRPERKFDGIEDLVAQIGRDVTAGREILASG